MNPRLLALLALAASAWLPAPAWSQELLTGDTRLACEAILCLSSNTRPGECSPSLHRYFGISHRKWRDTVRARANFLRLCPVSNQTPEMQALVSAMADGAGRCDAASLNATLRQRSGTDAWTVVIGNQAPAWCAAYTGHAYTAPGDLAPRYVGRPEREGYWVEAGDYERALAEYNARMAGRSPW